MNYELRLAELEDGPRIQRLIESSARGLGIGDYSAEQVEAALSGAFGMDAQLIRDRTYFVIEAQDELVACGGWSFRKKLFGAGKDQADSEEPASLDPQTEAAKIRAFFIAPEHARRGLGSLVLDHCEMAARERGFHRTELMATLTGLKLYKARGYLEGEALEHEVAPGLSISFVAMEKNLENPSG